MNKKPISEVNATMSQDSDLDFYQSIDNAFDGGIPKDQEPRKPQPRKKSKGDGHAEKIKADLSDEGGPIRTEPERGETEINTRSKLDQSTSIQVVAQLKKLLNKYNCLLKDYHIKFHNEGFDITKIRIIPYDVSALMLKVDKAQLIKFRDKPAALAMIIIADELRQICADELALKVKAYAYEKADIASLTVTNEDPEEAMDEFAALEPGLEAMAGGTPDDGLMPPDMGGDALGGPEAGAEAVGGPPGLEEPGAEETPPEAAPEAAEEVPPEEGNPEDEEDLEAAIADLSKSAPKKK
jgi:hypothetical protein